MQKKVFILLLGVTILLSAGIIAWSNLFADAETSSEVKVVDLLPDADASGWRFEDLPLGETESLKQRSEDVLNMDDYIFRRYSKGNISFDLFISYWKPGSQSVREVSIHVPDKCWVASGWEIIERDNDFSIGDDSTLIPSGRYRLCEKSGYRIEVIYWHFVGGKMEVAMEPSPVKRGIQFLTAPFRHGFNMNKEQVFIRISAHDKLSEIVNTEFFARVMEKSNIWN